MASKDVCYIDMDGVIVDFPPTIEDVDPSIRELARAYMKENNCHYSDYDGLFSTLKPIEGAIEAVKKLNKKFKVYLLSTAPWANHSALSDKRRFVHQYLPFLDRQLILSHRKDLCR